MPANFEWGFAGDVEMMQESAAAMGLALILAIAFIYIVLASQFESFLEPFLIMLSLPLALVGALLALLLTGQQHRHAGDDRRGDADGPGHEERDPARRPHEPATCARACSVKDAILKAGPVRLRPILMTTIAMILGMLPSAIGTGEGSEFRSPISIATIGGLITSTLLTLVVVPVAYLLLARVVERVQGVARDAGARAAGGARRGRACCSSRWWDGCSSHDATAFAQTAHGQPKPGDSVVTLTFDQALERALSAQRRPEGREGTRASRRRRACRKPRPTSCRR